MIHRLKSPVFMDFARNKYAEALEDLNKAGDVLQPQNSFTLEQL